MILAKGIGLARENRLNLGVESIAARRAEFFYELNRLGVQYSLKDALNIGRKNMEGKVIFLERGNAKAGLEHILQHANEFTDVGITKYDIGNLVVKAAT